MFEKKEKRLPDPTAVATNGVRKEDEEGFRANPIGIDFIFFQIKTNHEKWKAFLLYVAKSHIGYIEENS